MSKTVDSRIVEMQFDNKDFEKNINTSISSLDNLDRQLKNLEGAKGLEEMGKAAKKMNLDDAGEEVSKLSQKFSALEEVAIGSLRRIGEMATDMGIKLAKSLTIDQITAGFNEYETKMTSVQTMMNSTGESIDVVKDHLEQLNEYADKTIYSFSDMTSNIGKFTNAGVDLTTATEAIKGISNWAALAGANANEASRAMYNISQSMSGGYMQLIDWKSVKFANMATQTVLKNLADTAEVMGTIKKNADGTYDTITRNMKGKVGQGLNLQQLFNEGLNFQWLSTDVLMETMNHFSQDYGKTTEELAKMSEEERKLYESEKAAYINRLKSLGDTTKFTDEQIEAIIKLGHDANKAATEVKTFSMLLDTLKEAVGSGWAMSFEYIFGDLEQAKVLWTSVSDEIGGIIGRVSDWRNGILKEWGAAGGRNAIIEGFANLWRAFKEFVAPIGEAFREVFNSDATNTLLDISFRFRDFASSLKVSKELAEGLKGIFKALFTAIKATGNGIRIVWTVAQPLIKFGGKILELLIRLGGSFGNLISGLYGVGNASNSLLDGIVGLESRILGLIEPLEKFIDTMHLIFDAEWLDRESGIFHVFNTLYEIIKAVVALIIDSVSALTGLDLSKFEGKVIGAMNAFRDEVRLVVFQIQEWFSKIFDSETISKITRIFTDPTYRSQFFNAGVDLVRGLASGIWSAITIYLPNSIKGMFNAIYVGFCKLFGIASPSKVMSNLGFYLVEGLAVGIFMALRPVIFPAVNRLGTELINAFQTGEAFNKISEIGQNIVAGIGVGMTQAMAFIPRPILDVVNFIVDKFEEFFGIASPSRLMANVIGKYLIAGIVVGIIKFAEMVVPAIAEAFKPLDPYLDYVVNMYKTSFEVIFAVVKGIRDITMDLFGFFGEFHLGEKLAEYMKSLTPEETVMLLKQILTIATVIVSIISVLSTFSRVTKVTEKLVSPIEAIGGAVGSIGELAEAIKKDIKARALRALFRDLAIIILSMAGAIYILGKMDVNEMKQGAYVVGIMAIIMGTIVASLQLIASRTIFGVHALTEIGKYGILFASIGGSLFLLAMAIRSLGKANWDELTQAQDVLYAIFEYFTLYIAVVIGLTTRFGNMAVDNIWQTLLGAAGAVYIMSKALVKLGDMDPSGFEQAMLAITLIGALVGGIIFVTLFAARIDKGKTSAALGGLGFALIGLGICVNLIASAMRHLTALAKNSGGYWVAGLAAIVGIIGMIAAIIAVASRMNRAWKSLLSLAALFAAMGFVIKAVGSMKPAEIQRGVEVLAACSLFIIGLMAVTGFINKQYASEGTADIAKTLLGAAASIAIMALVVKMLSTVPDPTKAISTLWSLTEMMALLVYIAGIANGEAGTLKSSSKGSWKGFRKGGNYDRSSEKSAGPGFVQLIGIAVSIGILAYACAQLSKIPKQELDNAMIVMSVIALIIGVLMMVASRIGQMQDFKIGNVIAIGVTIAVITGALVLLASFADQWEGMLAGAIGIGIVLVAVGGMFKLIGSMPEFNVKQIITLVIVIAMMAGVMTVLGLVAKHSKEIDWEPLLAFGGSVFLVFAGIALALKAVNGVSIEDVGKLLLSTVALLPLAMAFYILAPAIVSVPWQNIIAAAGAMAIAVFAIAIVTAAAKSIDVKSALTLVIATAALIPAALALKLIAGFDWKQIGAAVIALALVIAGLVVAVQVLGGAAEIGAIGVALLLLIAGGLLIISGSIYIAVAAFNLFIKTLKMLFSKETAQGFIDFFTTIISGIPLIGTTLLAAIMALDALEPVLRAALKKLINSIGDGLVELAQTIETKGIEVIKAISKTVKTLKATVEKEFGIASPSKYFFGIGKLLMSGLANGILGGMPGPIKMMYKGVMSVINIARKVLGIHSPSWVFKAIGKLCMVGFAGGIIENMAAPKDAAKNAGEETTDSFKDGLGGLLDGSLVDEVKDSMNIESPDLDSMNIDEFTNSLSGANAEATNLDATLGNIQNKDNTINFTATLDTKGLSDATKKVMSGAYGNGLTRWKKLYEEYLKAFNGDTKKAIDAVVQIQNDINRQKGSSVVHTYEEMAGRLEKVAKDVKEVVKQGEEVSKAIIHGSDEYYRETTKAGNTINTKRNKDQVRYGYDNYYKQGSIGINELETNRLQTEKEITKEYQDQTEAQYKQLLRSNEVISAQERNMAKLRIKYLENKRASEDITNTERLRINALLDQYNAVVNTYNEQQQMRDVIKANAVEQQKYTDEVNKTKDALNETKTIIYGTKEYDDMHKRKTINNRKTIPAWMAKNSQEEIKPKVNTEEANNNLQGFADKTTQTNQTVVKNFEGINAGVAAHLNNVSNTVAKEGKNIEGECTKSFNNAVRASAKAVSSKENITLFENTGKALPNGLIVGIKSKLSDLVTIGSQMAKALKKGTTDELQVASPSKIFKAIGVFVAEGLSIGITSMADNVYAAGGDVADAAIDGVLDNITNLSNAMNNVDMTIEPSVVPVIDSNSMKNKINGIDNLTGQYRVSDIEANMNWNRTFESQQLDAMKMQLNDMTNAFNSLSTMLLNQPTPEVTANVTLQGDAAGIFRAVQQSNNQYQKMHGRSAFA